jgi:Reverse transcriptase (RNA-dependent DNA polymerase).
VYILLFVDDLLICCENEEVSAEIKNKLSEGFKIKDIGKVKNYIEIEYYCNQDDVLTLSQKSYIKSLAKRYDIYDNFEFSIS